MEPEAVCALGDEMDLGPAHVMLMCTRPLLAFVAAGPSQSARRSRRRTCDGASEVAMRERAAAEACPTMRRLRQRLVLSH